ncbi:hypothetical protein VE02_04078 [Pseudogymnoascus sp. 03VT05]|nr:hypothetical protein VE02_04078 [Pseudogymnoascus sp. 03VT05]
MALNQQVGYVEISSADKNYRILKVSTSLPEFPTATDREAKIYEHLAKVNSPHSGQALIRELYDSFDLQGSDGRHRCLVLQPMHMSLLEMMGLSPRPFDIPLLKMTVQCLLSALDFLHTEGGIIHADIKTDNLMLSIEDGEMLADFAKAEVDNPTPRKQVDQSRIIYKSRRLRRPDKLKGYGLPTLCDFGESRIGAAQESNPFIWDLFESEHLFGDVFDARGGHDPFKHFALMVALIGEPPSEFVGRSETTGQCFDTNDAHVGIWIAHKEEAIPLVSLGGLEKRLSGQEKQLFIQFMGSMLKWMPEERKTAKQLLEDPWLL